MEIKFVDIHSHIGLEEYGADQKNVIKRMHESGVATIAIGTGIESSKEIVRLAEENENIWVCIGVHPNDNLKEIFDEKEFEKIVSHPKVVAIGECGLDYYQIKNQESNIKNKQKEEFKKQVEFAIKHKKPLMLHIRDGEILGEAYQDVFDILNSTFDIQYSSPKGNVHFFSGALDWAKKFINLGFTLSFDGPITFPPSKKTFNNYTEVIKNVPLDMIHAETDSPLVAPVPYRGKRNEPAYVIEVVKKIAEIRGEDFEIVKLQLLKNAERVFGIKL